MTRMRNESGSVDLLLIAVVFVLAVGLGGYVYYQQQQAKKADMTAGTGVTVASHPKAKVASTTAEVISTSDWKTYSNSAFNISFKYPSTWKIQENVYSAQLHIVVSNIDPSQLQGASSNYGYIEITALTYVLSNITYPENKAVGTVEVNGSSYTLDEVLTNGILGPATDEVDLESCESAKSCTNVIKSKSGSVTVSIGGTKNSAGNAVNITSNEYSTAKAILQSLTY